MLTAGEPRDEDGRYSLVASHTSISQFVPGKDGRISPSVVSLDQNTVDKIQTVPVGSFLHARGYDFVIVEDPRAEFLLRTKRN